MDRYPYLVADVGGTHVRFGLVRAPRTDVTDIVTLRCADYPRPLAAVHEYLAGRGLGQSDLRRAGFAVATAISGDVIKLTNSAWSFDRREIADALGIEHVTLINDFEALALALPAFGKSDYFLLATVKPLPELAKAVVGPGTGLGVAAVVPVASGWVAVPGEGGHGTLAASDDLEAEVLSHARRERGHVSAERILSGIGLPVLLRAVCAVHGVAAIDDFSAAEISKRGIDGTDAQCRVTMDLFFAFLGSFAGNVALTFGARGGVFIGGGIVPKLCTFAAGSRFRERFEGKGRFQEYLTGISTAIITESHPALRGLAAAMEPRTFE